MDDGHEHMQLNLKLCFDVCLTMLPNMQKPEWESFEFLYVTMLSDRQNKISDDFLNGCQC